MVRGAILILVLLVAGFLVASAGLLPMSAASGHWALTRWALDYSQRRSIARQALKVTVPPLGDPALALRGAGHYETECRRCHGVPGREMAFALEEMLPKPPDLQFVAQRYSDGELFHIVKHGLKFTGMPGWPTLERDDEVWAMVAFLKTLPGLAPDRYEEVVFGTGQTPASAPPAVVATVCARCHGLDGLGRRPGAFPILAGQKATYLYLSLRAFAYGGRTSGIMAPIAAGLDDGMMRAAAEYYSSLPGLALAPDASSGSAEEGAQIASRGILEQRVPACADCHGPGQPFPHEAYPTLAGQYPGYLDLQLRLFGERHRGGTAFSHLMHEPADGLTADQRDAMAEYYSALRAPRSALP